MIRASVGHPLLEEFLRSQQVGGLSFTQISAALEIFKDGADSSECHSRESGQLAILSLDQRWPTQKSKDELETGRLVRAILVLP
jgi:hypothetical protein